MRVKSLLLIIVLNIFLTLAVSVMFEYNDLEDRISAMEDTINECILMAVDSSTASEELFSENYQHNATTGKIYSVGEVDRKDGSGRNTTSNSILIYDKNSGGCYYANPYILAMYYTSIGKGNVGDNGIFPTESEYEQFRDHTVHGANSTIGVYRYLFGGVGSDYMSGSLEWANRNSSIRNEYTTHNSSVGSAEYQINSGDRKPNSSSYNALEEYNLPSRSYNKLMNDFKSFYDNIGSKITTTAFVKKRDLELDATGNNFYTIKYENFPTLAQMGLELSDYNRVLSDEMTDNFCSVAHFGKRRLNGTSSVQKSIYFLTPYSLGVTYIPQSVFESTFAANLDTVVRFQRVSGGYLNGISVYDAMEGSTGCLDTSVFAVGNDRSLSSKLVEDYDNIGNREMKTHDLGSTNPRNIVNDGEIEYDLSSIETKIDYNVVDFYDYNNKDLVDAVIGGFGGYDSNGLPRGGSADNLKEQTIDALKAQDTQKKYNSSNTLGNMYGGNADHGDSGKRVVARITVRMKVHVLYHSSILQWISYATRDTYNENHFDIKLFDGKSGHIIEGEDGVYYQYTTYKVISR